MTPHNGKTTAPDSLFEGSQQFPDQNPKSPNQPQNSGQLSLTTHEFAPESAGRGNRVKRRRRVDPVTFEKQYSRDEMEFINAMQGFKLKTGNSFPSYGEVLAVARGLGYQRPSGLPDGSELRV